MIVLDMFLHFVIQSLSLIAILVRSNLVIVAEKRQKD